MEKTREYVPNGFQYFALVSVPVSQGQCSAIVRESSDCGQVPGETVMAVTLPRRCAHESDLHAGDAEPNMQSVAAKEGRH